MTGRRAGERVHGLSDAMQRRIGANGHIGSGKIIID